MQIIDHETFFAWIKAQPPERPVDMNQVYILDSCGCLMIQYARDKDIKCLSVGFKNFNNELCLDDEGSQLIRACFSHRIKSFSEAVQFIQ